MRDRIIEVDYLLFLLDHHMPAADGAHRIDQSLYPKCVGLFGPDSMMEFAASVIALREAGAEMGDQLLWRINITDRYNKYGTTLVALAVTKDLWDQLLPADHAMLLLPLEPDFPEELPDSPQSSYHRAATETLRLGDDGPAFKVFMCAVPDDQLRSFIDRVKPYLVGQWSSHLSRNELSSHTVRHLKRGGRVGPAPTPPDPSNI